MDYHRLSADRPPRPVRHDSSDPLFTSSDRDQAQDQEASTSNISRPSSSTTLDRLAMNVRHSRRDDWSFWLLGAVILLSWNVLICTLPLFQALLPPTSGLRHTLPSYITTVYTLGNFVFLGIAQRGVGKVSQPARLRKSLYILFLLTLLTPILLSTLFPTLSPIPFFLLLIALTLSFSLLTSFLQSSSIAIAALHGSKEMLCVMSGQGGVAVLIAGVQLYLGVVSVWGGDEGNPTPPDEHLQLHARFPISLKARDEGTGMTTTTTGEGSGVSNAQLSSGVGLWAISTIPILLCILVGKRLLSLDRPTDPSTHTHRGRKGPGETPSGDMDGVDPSEYDFNHPERHPAAAHGGFRPPGSGSGYRDTITTTPSTSMPVDEDGPEEEESRQLRFVAEEDQDERIRQTADGEGWRGMRRMIWRNRVVYFSVGWVFVVTLAVFPPITTTILSVHDPVPKFLVPSVFLPLHFLVFNLSDYIGRTYLPARPGFLITSHRKLLLASLGRTLFIPLFLLCNTGFRKTPLINSDLVYFCILFAFGASNGYISSLGMILASSSSLNPLIKESEKDVSGSLAGFCLTAGLAVGSMASFLVRWIVREGNPFVD